MTERQLTELIGKYLSGEASEDEIEQVNEWYESFDHSSLEFLDGDSSNLSRSTIQSLRAVWEKIGQAETSTQSSKEWPSGKSLKWTGRRLAIAAAILAILSFSWIAYLQIRKHQINQEALALASLEHDIAPGGNKAVLTLANGQKIVLDSAGNGLVSMQGNTKIMKLDSGRLSYNVPRGEHAKVLYNTIATPRGGQYQIWLPDGSKVWLNAASSIRFPTEFSGKSREVQIKGEAYFEIAKDPKRPFRIAIITHSGVEGEVEVLGTHFNIMAYDNEPFIKTTLVNGSVKVIKGDHSQILNPGEQARLNNRVDGDDRIRLVKGVNIYQEVAWKDNIFCFEGADVETVMRQLSMWYNIPINVEGHISDHFTGTIPRNVSVSKVFEVLQKTGSIHYKIHDQKIIVYP